MNKVQKKSISIVLKMDIENLNYDRGLIPAIIQDSISFNVLMLGYMNKDSLQHT